MEVTLKREHIRVQGVGDGLSALAAVADKQPQLVLLDITLPGMDGYQICQALKQRPVSKHIPVVMLSGRDGFFDKIRGRLVGSTQYVAGPESQAFLQESDLGPVYAHVKFKVSGNVCDPSYRLKDGDAAFLDPGTPVYQLNGYPPAERLAAHFNGQLVPYTPVGPSAIPASTPPSSPT